MNRIIIKVPAVHADVLEIGQDGASLGYDGYVIENIGDPFKDDQGWRMVAVTLVERTKP